MGRPSFVPSGRRLRMYPETAASAENIALVLRREQYGRLVRGLNNEQLADFEEWHTLYRIHHPGVSELVRLNAAVRHLQNLI